MKRFAMALILMVSALSSSMAQSPIYGVAVKDIDGNATSLKPYEGKVLLIVNVASRCGFTPQYAGLEALQKKYGEKGFTVLGFPCNQFRNQEPGTEQEIKQFCTSKYDVTFPMFSKIEVNGANRHPLYELLAGKNSPFPGDIGWNFTKFLVGRDGKIIQRFESKITPDSAAVTQAIESALAAK